MKKKAIYITVIVLLIVLVVALLVSCGSNPGTAVDEGTMPSEDSALDPTKSGEPAEKNPAETTAPETTANPTGASSSPAPATPAATPKPAQTHTHSWTPVTRTVHHEAVTEQVKIIDQPATEGWWEDGGGYSVHVCECGAEFYSASDLTAHATPFIINFIPGHSSGRVKTVHNDPIWHEGTPEVSHYETRVVRDAWDETVTTYTCSTCGATK